MNQINQENINQAVSFLGLSGLGTSLFVILGVILLWIIYLYNRLVTLKVRTEEAWADIDTQLKRRYDLIPNLVETVKGYAKHERETLEAVVKARSQATEIKIDAKDVTPEQMAAFEASQSGLSGALGKLFALAENYPDLKANQNFLELQRDLTDTEDKIQAARRFYNTSVRDLNTLIETFPSNIIASVFKFHKKEFFNLEENDPAKKVVKVEF